MISSYNIDLRFPLFGLAETHSDHLDVTSERYLSDFWNFESMKVQNTETLQSPFSVNIMRFQ